MLNKKSIFVFGKAQLSAFIGGIADWIIFLLCVQFGIHYTIAIWISGFLGALVNFSLNKYWTYDVPSKKSLPSELFKFYFVVVGSVILKSFGTYVMTEGLTIDCRISRLVVDLIVSLGYNYTLQRYWVFKKPNKQNTIEQSEMDIAYNTINQYEHKEA